MSLESSPRQVEGGLGIVVHRVLDVVEWKLAEMTMRAKKGGQYVQLEGLNIGNTRENRKSTKMAMKKCYTWESRYLSATEIDDTHMNADAG